MEWALWAENYAIIPLLISCFLTNRPAKYAPMTQSTSLKIYGMDTSKKEVHSVFFVSHAYWTTPAVWNKTRPMSPRVIACQARLVLPPKPARGTNIRLPQRKPPVNPTKCMSPPRRFANTGRPTAPSKR